MSGRAVDARYRSAAPPAPAVDWRAASFCVVDLETSGLDPRRDEVLSWAAVPIEQGAVRLAGARYGLVRPAGPIPASAIKIHGIRPADVAAAPSLDAMLDALLPALTGRILVVHVDWVERGFLGRALRRRGLALREPVCDTSRLARAALGGGERVLSLGVLSHRLGLPVHSPHEALGDALTTAQAFIAMARRLERDGSLSLGALCRAGTADGPRRRRAWLRLTAARRLRRW